PARHRRTVRGDGEDLPGTEAREARRQGEAREARPRQAGEAMTRLFVFAVLTAGVVSVSRADVPVAPPPREIRADGSPDPGPSPEAAPKEDPLAVVERIIKNSKDVGDKLAMTDTGTDTRNKQDKILKDIDALLNQEDPPPKSDMNKDMMDMKDMSDMKDMK